VSRLLSAAIFLFNLYAGIEACKLFNPESSSVYCLSYGLRTSYRAFEGGNYLIRRLRKTGPSIGNEGAAP
jgi:hypothetical protein